MKLTPEVEALMIKASHALEVSIKFHSEGEFPDAAGKIYYAMFHAAQAFSKLIASKHSIGGR